MTAGTPVKINKFESDTASFNESSNFDIESGTVLYNQIVSVTTKNISKLIEINSYLQQCHILVHLYSGETRLAGAVDLLDPNTYSLNSGQSLSEVKQIQIEYVGGETEQAPYLDGADLDNPLGNLIENIDYDLQ